MSEATFQARYYDGKSSTPYTVDLELTETGLTIRYTDTQNRAQLHIWEKSKIQHTEFSSSIVVLRYGDAFPFQQLEITDPVFVKAYQHHFQVPWLKRVMHKKGLTWVVALLGGFFGLLILAYIYLLPLFADAAARAFPREYEIEMGHDLYVNVLAEEEVDSAKTESINRFFAQLNTKSDYPISIAVVKKDIPNAFAMPGGGIVVYTGILDSMDRYEELAALLAHECSHVQLKHATRGLFRNLAGYLFVSLLFSDVNAVANILIENAHMLRNLSYSREMEKEADEEGLILLTNNRIDVTGMKNLFELLKDQSTIELNEFISTHPDLDVRIKAVNAYSKLHPQSPVVNDSLVYYFEQLH